MAQDDLFCYRGLARVPVDLAPRSTWHKRGFYVCMRAKPKARCKYFNGNYYAECLLFDLLDVKPLQGEIAKRRREEFYQLRDALRFA